MNHFVNISDHSPVELRQLLDVAARLKSEFRSRGCNDPLLACKTLAM